ncbi:hypothetical protein PSP20601_04977 [Pandoraea sputorum]|nr:hypothetical protein PSP20601_04977 [Pandoraea sputorum]
MSAQYPAPARCRLPHVSVRADDAWRRRPRASFRRARAGQASPRSRNTGRSLSPARHVSPPDGCDDTQRGARRQGGCASSHMVLTHTVHAVAVKAQTVARLRSTTFTYFPLVLPCADARTQPRNQRGNAEIERERSGFVGFVHFVHAQMQRPMRRSLAVKPYPCLQGIAGLSLHHTEAPAFALAALARLRAAAPATASPQGGDDGVSRLILRPVTIFAVAHDPTVGLARSTAFAPRALAWARDLLEHERPLAHPAAHRRGSSPFLARPSWLPARASVANRSSANARTAQSVQQTGQSLKGVGRCRRIERADPPIRMADAVAARRWGCARKLG